MYHYTNINYILKLFQENNLDPLMCSFDTFKNGIAIYCFQIEKTLK